MGCWEGKGGFSFRMASFNGKEGQWEGERHDASHRHFSPTTNVAMPQINAYIRWSGCSGVVEEEQVGNIHEAALERVEEGHMGKDEEKKDEDKDDNEAYQLREEEEGEEEEDEDEESGGEGEENDPKGEDGKREGNDGEEDKTSPI